MFVDIGGEPFDVTPKNAMFVRYQRMDILDGLFVDRDADYVYVSASSYTFEILHDSLQEAGVPTHFVSGEFNPDEAPHCWIVASVGRIIVDVAVAITEGENP